jgi:hypothetical protein
MPRTLGLPQKGAVWAGCTRQRGTLPKGTPVRIVARPCDLCLTKTQAVRYNCAVNRKQISKLAAALGKLGGSVKSKAKAKAARENGKKGGRPRKAKP